MRKVPKRGRARYKHAYNKGYEAGKRAATKNQVAGALNADAIASSATELLATKRLEREANNWLSINKLVAAIEELTGA